MATKPIIRNNLDVVRSDFDRIARAQPEGGRQSLHRYVRELLAFVPRSADRVLDVGCGTGAFTRALAPRARHVLGLDLSPQMVRLAQKRSIGLTNVQYEVGNVLSWRKPGDGFDCVTSILTLHHMPLFTALRRLAKLVRPGGTLIVFDLFQASGIERGLSILADKTQHWWRPTARSPELAHAWEVHSRHDVFTPLAAIRAAATDELGGAVVRRRPIWRYSLIWQKPETH